MLDWKTKLLSLCEKFGLDYVADGEWATVNGKRFEITGFELIKNDVKYQDALNDVIAAKVVKLVRGE